MKYTPRPYQEIITRRVLCHDRCAIWAGMGLGKTAAVLTALDGLVALGEGPVLVLAPLRVAASTWPDELRKWDHLRHLSMAVAVGTPERRAAALDKGADIVVTNYDNVPWVIDHLKGKWPFRVIVADESTKLKSFRDGQGGKRAQALSKVPYQRFVELTGTPSPNGLVDLWGQLWFLDHGQRLGESFDAFSARWFREKPQGKGAPEPRPGAQEQIQGRVEDICLSLRAEDYFDLSSLIINVVRVALPSKARAVYDRLENDMFAELDSGAQIFAVNSASMTMKCLQAANGALYTDDAGAWEELHDAKLQALEDIVEEAAGMPVLVAYHFKSDLARLLKRFPKGRYLDKNAETIRDWNKGKIPVLFAHPASAGHGLNLQDGGNIIAFFGHWWDLEQFQQIIERIGPVRQKQAGHPRPVFVHHIVAEDTIDEVIMRRRESKRQVQDLLLEAMKEKKRGKGNYAVGHRGP